MQIDSILTLIASSIGLTIILFLFFKFIIFGLLISKIEKISINTKNKFDDILIIAIRNIKFYFYLYISFYISFLIFLNFFLPNYIGLILEKVLIILIVWQILIFLFNIFDEITLMKSRKDGIKDVSKTSIGNLFRILKVLLFAFALIFLLDNFNYNITPLIAGLGIGGLAFAFAFQNILRDIFSSFVIAIDRPYRVGDYLIFNDKYGTVEKIGLKTTRIIGLDGEEIIVPNDTLTSSVIDNYGKTKERRIILKLNVAYNTSVNKLSKIPKDIEILISKLPNLRFDRAHLKFLADSSIDFEIVYYVNDRSYINYLDSNQELYLNILKYFEKQKIEIPFPTRTIYNRKD